MLSSAANPMYAGDSIMPGGYEPMPGQARGNTPFPTFVPPPNSAMPPTRTPFPRIPPAPPMGGISARAQFPRHPAVRPSARPFMRRPPVVPLGRPPTRRRHRRRPLTPEIVIDRRSHSHSSWGRNRVITVPLDSRPTLGLRGPPRRVVEIERVRCLRHRRCRSPRYEYDYDDPSPLPQPPPPPQPTTIVVNPIANPCLPPSNNTAAAATSTFLSNLTPEIIENLPKQTVHLPPIHLPGSQADANTELHTVLFPAEIINPVDGTLSIIQANPQSNGGGITNIQSNIASPPQLQSFNFPTAIGTSIAQGRPQLSPAMNTDPLMQRFHELFQRLRIPQTQPMPPTSIFPMNASTLPNISQFNPTNNMMNTPPTATPIYIPNEGGYPPANIRPVNPSNTGAYLPANITPYQTTSFTPSTPANNATAFPSNSVLSNSSDTGPYRPANITPYTNMANRSTNNPVSQPSFSSASTPYASAASLASTSSFTPFPSLSSRPSAFGNNSLNPLSSSPPLAPTSYQPYNLMPKSILRNGPSTSLSNTTYTPLSSSNVFSSTNATPKTTRFT